MQWIHQQCTDDQWLQLQQYVDIITTINTRINLISRQDTDKIMEHHIAPCMAYARLERISNRQHILDIGSGGGFPGIVNAILFPESEFLLVDSTRKKVHALDEMISELQLANVTAKWARVEELANDPSLQESFDHTTSRAVAPLRQLVKWSRPFLKPGGTVEALKGGDRSDEIKQVKHPVETFTLPKNDQLTDRLRSLVICSVKPL